MTKTTSEDFEGRFYLTFAKTAAFSKASQEALLEIIKDKGLRVITPDRRELMIDGIIIHTSAHKRFENLNGEA